MKPNLDYINALSRGDEAFKQSLINVIKKEFPEEVATYHKNLEAKNYGNAANNVHKLKHKITILSLVKSYKITEKHEDALKANDESFVEDFEAILTIIKDFLNKI